MSHGLSYSELGFMSVSGRLRPDHYCIPVSHLGMWETLDSGLSVANFDFQTFKK